MILFDALVCLLVIMFGYNLKNLFSGFSPWDKNILNNLYWFHLVMGLAFHFYIMVYGGDAQHYWGQPKDLPFNEIIELVLRGSPSGSVFLLNYFPSKVLGLSFFVGNMIYAQLGYLAFLLLYLISKELFGNFSNILHFKIFNIPIFPWIWFMPNMHFWSGGIGKDTLLFLCIASFIYALSNLKARLFWVAFSIIISIAVRPHITLFLLFSFGLGYVFDGNLRGYQKGAIILILVVAVVPLSGYVMSFIQLDSIETNVIGEYTSKKSASLNAARSGSGVDTSNYPFPLKVFTFLYRPLFLDITNAIGVLASFENLILILFTIKVFKNNAFLAFRKSNYIIKGSFLFFCLGTIGFSLILGNLGIMLRQKNMFIPWFFMFGLWVFHFAYNNLKVARS